MGRAALSSDPSLAGITAAGFVATIGQVLLLREFLVLFHGNELSTALALAGWLLWTALGSGVAARRAGRGRLRETTLALLLVLLAVALPALVLMARAARAVFAVPSGELVPFGTMVVICLTAPALFGLVSGSLFGLCWAYRREGTADGARTRPLAIYLGEAGGAALGGVAFYFVLLRITTAVTTAAVVALLPLAIAGWILWEHRGEKGVLASATRFAWALIALAAVIFTGTVLEEGSRRWQWGEELVLAHDTPFHNIAVLRQPEQVTVFTNGLWIFTQPDPASAEAAVHPALLLHPRPRRVLLLGGGLAGHVLEALRHPTIAMIDYVEQDPELIERSLEFLTPEVQASLADPLLEIHHEDAVAFLRRSHGRYDVVLMSTGDPINAQMNRFFTVEMFRQLAVHIAPGGFLTFSMPGGGDLIGPAHARLLGSMNRTLREVFPEVRLVPGTRARFFAAREEPTLLLDPALLATRLEERELDLRHVRADTLYDLWSPFRLDYARSLLGELEGSPVNRQFAPVCYLHGLRLWSAQWHPKLGRMLGAVASIGPATPSIAFAIFGAIVVLGFWIGRCRYRTAVRVSVLVQGAAGMVIQVVLILGFQILEGFAYLELALIIALFMAGLAAGTLAVAALGKNRPELLAGAGAIRGFAVVQSAVGIFPFALLLFFLPVADPLRDVLFASAASWLFSAASFVAGTLGGAHFSLAALAVAVAGGQLGRAGGSLYAADLAGAAGGALAAGLVLLPLYGVPATLVLLGAASLVCLLIVLRRPR